MKLLFWIIVSKIFIILVILYSGIGLMPDEAQYWTWSKALSYGYYSKPAGIAWQIAFGCSIFGDTELGVRFGSVILSIFLSYGIYWLAKGVGLDEKKSTIAALAFTFSPLGMLSSFFATTDCAYVLFWTLACTCFVAGYSAWIVVAIGALWKWPIYAIWLPIISFRPSKKMLIGALLSLVGLIPSLIWNLQHGFATFLHVFTSIDPMPNLGGGNPNPVDFLGAQAALVSPLLFLLILFAAISFIKRYRKEATALQFCFVTFAAFFLVVFTASFFRKVQGNWAVASYPAAFILMLWAVTNMRWIKAAIGISVVLILTAFSLPFTNVPLRKNPWKEGLGWHAFAPSLLESGYDPASHFLFSDRYQMTSLLSFYGPQQRRAYFLNIHGLRRNQFSYWPGMQHECVGKSGYFVEVVMNKDPEAEAEKMKQQLMPYFSSITILPSKPLFREEKRAIFLLCEGYTGNAPADPNRY